MREKGVYETREYIPGFSFGGKEEEEGGGVTNCLFFSMGGGFCRSLVIFFLLLCEFYHSFIISFGLRILSFLHNFFQSANFVLSLFPPPFS